MGDVAFLLDTTCSMSRTLDAMKTEFSAIVSSISAALPDAEYAVATFDDYNYSGMGTGQDRPFILSQQVTSNTGTIQNVLNGLGLHNGDDLPESTLEAIYQAVTGIGYDQNCNGRYDSTTDVKPFIASASDPFGGSGGSAGNASGSGTVGGMGFRPYALPIIIYATDAELRDPDKGSSSPRGCPGDAGSNDVIAATNSLGAFLIGIAVNNRSVGTQMDQLANATGSLADLNGDGIVNEELVFEWNGSSSAFRTTVTSAIEDLVSSVRFSEINLDIEGDENGFVVDIEPDTYTLSGAVTGEVVEFTLLFRGTVAETEEDQIHKLTLNVFGDGTVLLDTQDIYVVVPGTSYSGN
jgi:hypothetical protein